MRRATFELLSLQSRQDFTYMNYNVVYTCIIIIIYAGTCKNYVTASKYRVQIDLYITIYNLREYTTIDATQFFAILVHGIKMNLDRLIIIVASPPSRYAKILSVFYYIQCNIKTVI
jgi:hypothetical protein